MTVDGYFDTVKKTLDSLDRKSMDSFVELIWDCYEREGTLYFFCFVGSGGNASHMCGDMVKDVSNGLEKRFKVMCLNDNVPSMMAVANDISYDDIFLEPLKNFLQAGDLVVGISGSGNSPNVVKALLYAKQKDVSTVALCGFDGGKIKEIADLSVHAQVQDMEVSEDIHSIIGHAVKKLLMEKLGK
jgi:D-sedoheptulose 7-phosphate isomerase